MPRWTYRRVIRSIPPGGVPQPVNVTGNDAVFGGEQWAEPMLCTNCEQRLGVWDNYASQIALHVDDTFPARAQAQRKPELDVEDWLGVDLSALNVASLTRFATSVIWRAHTSSEFFPEVRLGPHAATLAAYLLDPNAALPDCARLIVHIIEHQRGPRVDRVVVGPAASREDGYHVHHFATFGMWFRLMVGSQIPRVFDHACVARTNHAWISDGRRLMESIYEKARTVATRGALARR